MDDREVPSRRRLLEVLEQASAALAVGDLAAAVGLHPNTVRLHLDALVDAGLVAVVRAPASSGSRGRPPMRYAPSGGFLGHFVREGMDPEVTDEGRTIVLRHCPYATLVTAAPAIVCELHQTVLDGISDASGAQARLAPGAPCVVHLTTS